MFTPGLRLRRVREKLGLTYREVEKASYELALKRGRPDFFTRWRVASRKSGKHHTKRKSLGG
jgi:hypothetical protein